MEALGHGNCNFSALHGKLSCVQLTALRESERRTSRPAGRRFLVKDPLGLLSRQRVDWE
jgi:hypothetical protein